MEQAVNQFNKGLLMDTHPMVLGNDTLSDALNATFITMNGNEVVLQNDMGNRRIDNAFLPSGYLPLGMKEYGGVIYVTAYNPITNRGQVGSFPSPLRKINIDNQKDGVFICPDDFIGVENSDGKDIHIISREYIVIPISDKMVLHTGDKFSIYSQQIRDILPYLTLPEHTKNNLFTFLIGIFNSQNEFIDISNKLKLWDVYGYKYYINSESGVPEHETIADSELLRARNRLAINTYSLKMSSPLYLKAIINHINDISYSITGEIVGDTNVNLEIEVTFLYNCVDFLPGSERYFEIEFNGKIYLMSEVVENSTYSEEIELYIVTYLYKINNLLVTLDEIKGLKKYKYELKFPLLHDFKDWIGKGYDPIYIKSLNKSGELDLSKLNSDTLIFKGYRYYNDTFKELTTLVVNLESYPKKVSNLHFCTVLRDPKTNKIIKIEENEPEEIIDKYKPGTGTITTLFSYANLEKRKLYRFEFYYYNDLLKTPKDLKRGFYITTPIFNGNYIGEKGSSLDEFKSKGLVDEAIHYSYDVMNNIYIEDFSKIDKILLSPILNSSVSSIPIENSVSILGNYILPLSTISNITSYTVTEINKIKNTIEVSASVNNIEIYPSEVETLLEIENINNPIKNIERSINEDLMEKSGNSYTLKDDSNLKEILDPEIALPNVISITELSSSLNLELNLQRILLISTISVLNSIKGYLEEKSIHCDHLISSFGSLIKKYYYGLNQMDYITLRPPYITIDWEGTDHVSIGSSISLEDLGSATWRKESDLPSLSGKIKVARKNFPSAISTCNIYIDEVVRDNISDYLLSNCDGLLIVGEYTGDDNIVGFLPCMSGDRINYDGLGRIIGGMIHGKTFKRLWLRINKKEYIPIYTIVKKDDDDNILLNFYNDKKAFDLIFSNIPHYYEYETGGKTLLEKIINPVKMNKTIEFEVDSNINILITEKIGLKEENYSLLEGDISYYGLTKEGEMVSSGNSIVSDRIFFKEGTITSNEDFIDEIENLSNYHVSSAIIWGNEDNPDHKLLIRDCDGNIIDPLYVYYNKYETSFMNGNVFKKSYIADKFYVPDLDIYMPEIKSSRKLYGGEFGEHGLINEYVYPVKNIRKLLIDTIDVLIDLEEKETSDTTDKGPWDKTYILYEGGETDPRDYLLPLRTRNIFNQKTILDYSLTTPDANGDSSMYNSFTRQNEWIDYDTYIKQLNNN